MTGLSYAWGSIVPFQSRQPRPLTGPAGENAIFDPASAKGQLIIDDGQSQVRATLAGAGISLNALWSVHDQLKSGRLIRVLPNFEASEDNVLWLIYPKSNVLSPKVRVFMDFLIAEIGIKSPWET